MGSCFLVSIVCNQSKADLKEAVGHLKVKAKNI